MCLDWSQIGIPSRHPGQAHEKHQDRVATARQRRCMFRPRITNLSRPSTLIRSQNSRATISNEARDRDRDRKLTTQPRSAGSAYYLTLPSAKVCLTTPPSGPALLSYEILRCRYSRYLSVKNPLCSASRL